MMELRKIEAKDLQYLGEYFLENRNSFERVIADFGEVESDNGYGTIFLKPRNPLFKVFWLFRKDNKIISVGFGCLNLGLSLRDLYSVYGKYREGFNRYDEEYVYVFYSTEDFQYTIKINSSKKLFVEGKMINDIPINGIEIHLT